RTLHAAHTERPYLPCLDERQRFDQRREYRLDRAGDEIGDGRRPALVGHLHHVTAGHVVEQRTREVLGGAVSGSTVVHPVLSAFHVSNELGEGVDGQL